MIFTDEILKLAEQAYLKAEKGSIVYPNAMKASLEAVFAMQEEEEKSDLRPLREKLLDAIPDVYCKPEDYQERCACLRPTYYAKAIGDQSHAYCSICEKRCNSNRIKPNTVKFEKKTLLEFAEDKFCFMNNAKLGIAYNIIKIISDYLEQE